MADSIGIIDGWAQPYRKSWMDNLPEVHELFEKSKSPASEIINKFYTKTGEDPPASFIVEEMDKNNVDKLMLCSWQRPNGKKLVTNEEILKDYVFKYPTRFIGICSVNLNDPMSAVNEIEKYCNLSSINKFNSAYVFRGVRVLPWLWDKAPTHRYFYPIYVKCCQLDIVFCTQVGHTGPLCPSQVGRPIPYIDQVALDFPKLKILCGHTGYPWVEEMIGVAWKHKNVYIDTSAWQPKYYPKPLVHFINTYGKHKVLFGTNYPHLTLDECAKQARKLPINEKSMKLFLRDNAKRLFKLGESNAQAIRSKL